MSDVIALKEPFKERDAIIYVPGLFSQNGDQTADRMAQRFASALNEETRPGERIFGVSPGVDEPVGDGSAGARARVVSVWSRESEIKDDARTLFDVYQLDYAQAFRREAAKWPPFVHAVIVTMLIVFNIVPIVRSLFAKSQTLGHRMQALWGIAFMLIMVAYVGALAYTSYDAVKTAAGVAKSAPANVTTAAPALQKSKTVAYGEAIVLLLTALGFMTKTSLKQMIVSLGIESSGALGYIAYGWRDGSMAGAVAALIDHVIQKAPSKNIRYRRVHLIAYSFGSIISLDALFPLISDEPVERVRDIHTLVTIGCPFDFIRSYWPKYFTQRGGFDGIPQRWLNIYRPDDVLASDFTDNRFGRTEEQGILLEKHGEPRKPVNQRYGRTMTGGLGGVILSGFRAHGTYWNHDETTDVNAFHDAMKYIFKDEYPLKAETPVAQVG